MSRLAKKSISIPTGVTLEERDRKLWVKGPKGELVVAIPRGLEVLVEGQTVSVRATEGTATEKNPHIGTTWSHIRNSVEGVANGFSKILEIEGVGYKGVLDGKTLVLSLGFVNPIKINPPSGVTIVVEKNIVTISGASKESVNQTAAEIRSHKEPEPYKGKGIHYRGEVIRRKVGKKAGATTA